MKFVRFVLGATICLFAIYGGYELYVQKFANNEISGDVVQELREAGFDVSEGDAKNGLSGIFQNEPIGRPSASFSMGASPPTPYQETTPNVQAMPPSARASGGLPPSLRRNDTPVTVTFPEHSSQPYSSAISSFASPPTPVSPPTVSAQAPDPFFPPLPGSSEAFRQALDVPLFLNSDSAAMTPPPTIDLTGDLTGEATSKRQGNAETPLTDFGLNANNTPQLPVQSPPTPPIQEQIPAQPPEQVPAQWASAYTFGVAAPPAVDIRTTREPTPQQPNVFPPPVVVPVEQPRIEQQSVNSSVGEATTNPPITVTPHPHVQPLPPIGNEPTNPQVYQQANQQVLIPHLQVISLPPVEEEVPATDNRWAMTPGLPNPPQIALPDPPPVETPFAAGLPPQYVQSDPGTLQPQVTIPAQISPSNQQFVRQDSSPQLPPAPPLTVAPAMSATQPDVQQAVLPQPVQQQQIAQVNNVTPLPQPPQENGIDPEVVSKVAKIGELLTQNQVNEAYEKLSRMYFHDEMTTEERQYVAKHLDLLAGGVLFSRRHHILEAPYMVKEGDTIESIAVQYKITPELLRKLNGIPGTANAAAGTELKVLRGPLDARIYPNFHELVITMRDKYACRFPVSVGSSYAGQAGRFTVQEKALNRGYQLAPGMEVIPPGDPANPLGAQWIELSKEQGTIGIHGTNRPEQIGTTRISAGFFGLRDQDIAEVYDMLTVGSSVTIVR